MDIVSDLRSPNFDPVEIPVEYIVLHYTAGRLQRALDILNNPEKRVSAHLVIAEDGKAYELVECLQGKAFRAWHAGESRWMAEGKTWEKFNDFSIGIELVNPNGNILAYTDQQYTALRAIIIHLRKIYPALNSPERILGHEHISGWRGKVDPGWEFDWKRFFNSSYSGGTLPKRNPQCPAELRESLVNFLPAIPDKFEEEIQFWEALSLMTETSVRLIRAGKP